MGSCVGVGVVVGGGRRGVLVAGGLAVGVGVSGTHEPVTSTVTGLLDSSVCWFRLSVIATLVVMGQLPVKWGATAYVIVGGMA